MTQSYSYREKEPTGVHWMLFTNSDGTPAPLLLDLGTWHKYKAMYGYPSVRWTDVAPPGWDPDHGAHPKVEVIGPREWKL